MSQAILIEPGYAQAFADLAGVLRATGRQEFALKALETAIAMGHRTARTYTDLGDILGALGRHAESAAAHRTAAELRSAPAIAGAAPAVAFGPSAEGAAWTGTDIPEHWRQVQLVLIEPDNYPHSAGLSDLLAAFGHAFARLGVRTEIVRNAFSTRGMNVVFGAHLIGSRAVADSLPANTVLVNLEQLRGNNIEAQSIYADLLQRLAVWDHSQRNIAELRALTGNERVHRIGIGFVPQMQRIAPTAEQPVDVLFYGSLNDRRRAILNALQAAGLAVRCLYGVYGAERDRAIADAKVVLNVHFYEDSIHEIVRTSHLLANGKAVVCECNPATEIDEDIRRALVAKPYGELVEACVALLADEPRRREVERQALEIFSRRCQAADAGRGHRRHIAAHAAHDQPRQRQVLDARLSQHRRRSQVGPRPAGRHLRSGLARQGLRVPALRRAAAVPRRLRRHRHQRCARAHPRPPRVHDELPGAARRRRPHAGERARTTCRTGPGRTPPTCAPSTSAAGSTTRIGIGIWAGPRRASSFSRWRWS